MVVPLWSRESNLENYTVNETPHELKGELDVQDVPTRVVAMDDSKIVGRDGLCPKRWGRTRTTKSFKVSFFLVAATRHVEGRRHKCTNAHMESFDAPERVRGVLMAKSAVAPWMAAARTSERSRKECGEHFA